MRTLLLASLAALLTGCDAYHYHAGRWHEARRNGPAALRHYEAFIAARPKDPRTAQLRYQAGSLYARMGRCLEARRHFEATARDFQGVEPWAGRSRDALLTCPDYFPMGAGRSWVYGDSASGGRAARQEWRVVSSSPTVIETALYAGQKRVTSGSARYEVSDWTIWQEDKEGRFALLRYPFQAGRSWEAKRGKRRLTYTIDSDDAAVSTKAGDFTGCLKVRESDKGLREAWRYDYYCPSVGRALTSVAGEGYENPNMELLSREPR